MKDAINLSFVFVVYCLIGSMESNAISLKTGLILIGVVGVVALLVNRKKSVTCAKRSGQAHKEHTKLIHKNCTPYKGGVSSGL